MRASPWAPSPCGMGPITEIGVRDDLAQSVGAPTLAKPRTRFALARGRVLGLSRYRRIHHERPPVHRKGRRIRRGQYRLLTTSPGRYLVRSILAGMYLSIVVFIYWLLLDNLAGTAFGKVVASGFFGVGLVMIVLTNTELFTS